MRSQRSLEPFFFEAKSGSMNPSVDRRDYPSEANPSLMADRRDSGLDDPSKGFKDLPENLSEDLQPRLQKITSLPTISVNDKPILARERKLPHYNSPATEKRKPSLCWSRQVHHDASKDLTSAAAGMFSECMFESPPRKPSGGSSSSASSKLDWIECEHLRRHSSSQTSSQKHRRNHSQTFHRYGGSTPSNYHEKRHPARSYSSTFAPDRKRLVNQFLRFVEPDGATQTKAPVDFTNMPAFEADQGNGKLGLGGRGTLQGLLYRELEQLSISMAKPPPVTAPGQAGASSPSVSSSQSALPEDASLSSSSSYGVSDESYISPEFDLDNEVYDLNDRSYLNYNEVDCFRNHIVNQLHNFENVLKQNLKEVLLKDEYGFQRNLKTFDIVSMDLQSLKQEVSEMYESIKNQTLASLRREFDESEKDTFMSRTTTIVAENLRQLESLENRIEVSKEKLVRQRETLKKMESLLSLKDDMLESQRNTKLAYQYRYMVFDLGAFTLLIFICILIKWML